MFTFVLIQTHWKFFFFFKIHLHLKALFTELKKMHRATFCCAVIFYRSHRSADNKRMYGHEGNLPLRLKL